MGDEGEALADDERLVRLGLPMATLLLTLENDKGTKVSGRLTGNPLFLLMEQGQRPHAIQADRR